MIFSLKVRKISFYQKVELRRFWGTDPNDLLPLQFVWYVMLRLYIETWYQ